MKNFTLKNPMCIRLSEETIPADPTPHYKIKKSASYKGGVNAIEKDGTVREFNTLSEASDYYDIDSPGILRAMTLKRTYCGIAFRYPSFTNDKDNTEASREDVENY